VVLLYRKDVGRELSWSIVLECSRRRGFWRRDGSRDGVSYKIESYPSFGEAGYGVTLLCGAWYEGRTKKFGDFVRGRYGNVG
jgi:hypothetical protein